MSIVLRPDYKAGDAEFDWDAELVRVYEGLWGACNNDATKSLMRQIVYWRHQAETQPTPEQIFADEAWCRAEGYVKADKS